MAGLLLDGLLLLVVALYVPIGAWRGGVREAMLGGSILLGAATADALAPTWGGALADATGTDDGMVRFLVAIALLLAIGLGIGFAAGVVAGHDAPGFESRFAGGMIGGANALILLGFALVFLNRFLHGGATNETVQAGVFADALAEHQGWVLGFATVLAVGLVAACRVIDRAAEGVPPVSGRAEDAGASSRRRLVVAPPADPDGGKVEPEPVRLGWAQLNADPGVQSLNLLTRSVGQRPIEQERTDVRPARTGGAGNGHAERSSAVDDRGTTAGGSRSVVDEWLRRAANESPQGAMAADPDDKARSGDPPPSAGSSIAFSDAAFRNLLDPPARRGGSPPSKPDAPTGMDHAVESEGDVAGPAREGAPRTAALDPVRRCGVCGTPAASELLACPFCGNPL